MFAGFLVGAQGRGRTGTAFFGPQDFKSCVSTNFTTRATKKKSTLKIGWILSGAEDEVRTRDLNLGKVALYQLSYFRIFCKNCLFIVGVAKIRGFLFLPTFLQLFFRFFFYL